jgi:putative sigma-54 modulation protein
VPTNVEKVLMQVTITFRGMDSTEALKSYVKERIEHVEKYFDRSVEGHVTLSLERYLHHADLSIQAGHFLLRGKSKSEDMYKSIDEAMDKIEKQVKRYKDKIRTSKHRAKDDNEVKVRHNVISVQPPDVEESEEWAAGPKVIKSREIAVQTLTVDEAVMQMDLLNNDFLVFRNAKTSEVNVVYHRKDGHIGLIEAPAGKAEPAAKKGKNHDARA